MDNLVSEAQDVDIPELNFGLPATAQFVTERRMGNWFPSGSSIYSPKDNKNIRIFRFR